MVYHIVYNEVYNIYCIYIYILYCILYCVVYQIFLLARTDQYGSLSHITSTKGNLSLMSERRVPPCRVGRKRHSSGSESIRLLPSRIPWTRSEGIPSHFIPDGWGITKTSSPPTPVDYANKIHNPVASDIQDLKISRFRR